MSIDWDKPLACVHGPVVLLEDAPKCLEGRWVKYGDTHWVADRETGRSVGKFDLPRVYNKKPEPQEGEYWLIKDVHDHERVVYFDGKMFIDGPTCNEAYLDAILIDKMERVEE